MAQVLHIFRKDVRHLWPRIFIIMLLAIAHAVYEVRSLPVNVPEVARANSMSILLNVLLPLGIWFLIAWLIFQEPLPDDRQFWLTQPYSRSKLLLSKVLFVLIFANAPLFVSDCYILGTQGFAVLAVLPDLLLRQLFLTVLFILPSFAIATITAGISQFLLAWFILLMVPLCEIMLVSFWSRGNTAINFESRSMFIGVLAVTASAIVVWQYAARRTRIARLVLLSVVGGFLPASWGFSLAYSKLLPAEEQTSKDETGVQITFDRRPFNYIPWTGQSPPPGFVLARIPLRVTSLPRKTLLRGSSRNAFNIRGTAWPQGGGFVVGEVQRIREPYSQSDEYWQTMHLDIPSLNLLKQQPVDMHSSFELEIVADEVETTVPVTVRSVMVPGLGLCHTFEDPAQVQITCRAGLTPSIETAVRLNGPEAPPLAAFMEHSLPWGLSPTSEVGSASFSPVSPGAKFEFIPRRKVAKFRRTLEMQRVQLANYILPR